MRDKIESRREQRIAKIQTKEYFSEHRKTH
jgi:hypothetical protein